MACRRSAAYRPQWMRVETDDLVFIVFDLLFLNGRTTATLPLIERKERLRTFSRVRSTGCDSATTSWAMAIGSMKRLAGWVSKASCPSAWTAPMRPAIGGSG